MRVELGDLLEALIATGQLDEAAGILVEWEPRAAALDRAWAARDPRPLPRPAARRARRPRRRLRELRPRTRRTRPRRRPVPRARTLLALGRTQRRAKKRGAARATLEDALARFETLGAPLWADQTRAELGPHRRPGPVGRRAHRRPNAASPRSSRRGARTSEVAAALFLTEHSVETALTRIYRKLGDPFPRRTRKALFQTAEVSSFRGGAVGASLERKTTGSAGTRDDGRAAGPRGCSIMKRRISLAAVAGPGRNARRSGPRCRPRRPRGTTQSCTGARSPRLRSRRRRPQAARSVRRRAAPCWPGWCTARCTTRSPPSTGAWSRSRRVWRHRRTRRPKPPSRRRPVTCWWPACPGQAAAVQAAYDTLHGGDPRRAGKDGGKAVGAAAAAGMLALRTGDHFDDVVPYVQPTRRARACSSRSRRRTPVDVKLAQGAPVHVRPTARLPARRRRYALTSKQYAEDVAELQAIGRIDEHRADARRRPRRFASSPTRPIVQYSRGLRGLVNERRARPARVRAAPRVHVGRGRGHDDRLLGGEVPLHVLAPEPRDPAGGHRRQPGHVARPDLASARHGQPPGVPVGPRLLHRRGDEVAAASSSAPSMAAAHGHEHRRPARRGRTHSSVSS